MAMDERLTKTAVERFFYRSRRLRRTPPLRSLLREVVLQRQDLVCPLFIRDGENERRPIASMPGTFQLSVDQLEREVEELDELGIPAVILFGIPVEKDPMGLESHSPDGIVQQAIRRLKELAPDLIVISDVCLCEYTDHGHCGLLNLGDPLPRPTLPEGHVLNDETLEILGQVATSHASAGADLVAPSGMIDGMVHAIRGALDEAGYEHVAILSYAVKYASAFYGPFRDAAESPPMFGDRRSHQMDPSNAREALREASSDSREGADVLMVKPALPYLDILQRLRHAFPEMPLAAYNVSGEYAMVKSAAANGWLDEAGVVMELLTSIKRAGADFILTYHAKDAARWLAEHSAAKMGFGRMEMSRE